MYGTDLPEIEGDAIVEKTAALLGMYGFHFPLLNYAHRIVSPANAQNYLADYGPPGEPLRDADI